MTEMGFADHLPFLGGWAAAPRPHRRLGDGAGRAGRLRRARPGPGARVRGRRAHRPRHRGRLHPRDAGADGGRSSSSTRSSTSSARCTSSATASASTIRRWRAGCAEYGLDRIHLESLELARQAAETGLFDVIGHLDHAKKFGPPEDEEAVAAAASAALRAVAAAGMLARAQHRRPAQAHRRAVPGARRCWPRRAACGIPLVFGSDAHRPGDVGHGFDRAAELARAAGYTGVLSLSGRRRRGAGVTLAGQRARRHLQPALRRRGVQARRAAHLRRPSRPRATRSRSSRPPSPATPAPRARGGGRRVRPRLRRRRRRHRQRDHQRPRRQRRPARHHPHRHRQRAGHGARHPARAAGRGQAARGRHGLVDRPRAGRRPLLRPHGRRRHGRGRRRVDAARR